MARARSLSLFLALSLLGNAFCAPADVPRLRRGYSDNEDNEVESKEAAAPPVRDLNNLEIDDVASIVTSSTTEAEEEFASPDPWDDDDDDFDSFEEPMSVSPTTGGGSSIFSLLRLANALFPGSSRSNIMLRNLMHELVTLYQPNLFMRRQDVGINEIDVDYKSELKPSFQRQESDEDASVSTSEDSDSESEDEKENSNSKESNEEGEDTRECSEEDKNNAAEESAEVKSNGNGNDASVSKPKQDDADGDSDDDEDDDDSDEPPGGGDGQGGGVLGFLAGLSGGEDGQSDLGSLLAAVGGIVANLSGDGIDINALIASGLGLFVGLLSEGEENPGAVIASYLQTSLDSISGGGSKNNGAFFGTFLSKLIKGISAHPDASSEENGNGMNMADSAGFFASFLMGLLGDMSKGSSGGSSSNHWERSLQQWR